MEIKTPSQLCHPPPRPPGEGSECHTWQKGCRIPAAILPQPCTINWGLFHFFNGIPSKLRAAATSCFQHVQEAPQPLGALQTSRCHPKSTAMVWGQARTHEVLAGMASGDIVWPLVLPPCSADCFPSALGGCFNSCSFAITPGKPKQGDYSCHRV